MTVMKKWTFNTQMNQNQVMSKEAQISFQKKIFQK